MSNGLGGKIHFTLPDLLRVMQRLRDPDGGCPWDLKQDFKSIVPSTLEECYELADAIEREDLPHVLEELGDVLFQVVFYSQLGVEQDAFDFHAVINTLVEKLIRRHPHVFAHGEIEGRVEQRISTEQVKANWEAIKRVEREGKAKTGVLADVPTTLPALPRAQKLQKRAANIGFDWVALDAVVKNLENELAEFKEALQSGNPEHVADEFGDILFSAVNVGRHLRIDSETALRGANAKFERRFTCMEALASEQGCQLSSLTADQLENLWMLAKQSE